MKKTRNFTKQNFLSNYNKNRALIFFIIVCLTLVISCTKTTEYIYCNDIQCSSGRYVVKESSVDFQTYIKDSIKYSVEIQKESKFNEKTFLVIDSIMKIKNYISKKERKILKKTKKKIEYVNGKWGREYCISYIFDFKSQKQLNKFKIAYLKWKCSSMIPVVEAISENNPKYQGTLDTLKNGKLMKKLIAENNNIFSLKKNKLYYYIKSPEKKYQLDSINIIFPKPIKNITKSNIRHKISKDRKTLILFDSIGQVKTKSNLIINFSK